VAEVVGRQIIRLTVQIKVDQVHLAADLRDP
jgi:hypothetical protein